MGSKKKHKEQFLRKHPTCCFCGGKTASKTIDHIPSRAIFDNREWPQGYEFPACALCNNITRQEELTVSTLSRVNGCKEPEEIRQAIQGIKNNQPYIFEEWKSTEAQRSKYPTALNIGPDTNRAILLFGHKLGLALYYFHTNKIISQNGGTYIPRWYSNGDYLEGLIPELITEFKGNNVDLKRQNTSLKEQFNYEYMIDKEQNIAVFQATFRFSFLIPIFVVETVNNIANKEIIFQKPFNHHQ